MNFTAKYWIGVDLFLQFVSDSKQPTYIHSKDKRSGILAVKCEMCEQHTALNA